MPSGKKFKKPFWALLVLTILITVYSIYSFSYLNNSNRVPPDYLRELSWRSSITVMSLIVESVIYFKISHLRIIPWLAWCHIILLYFSLIGPPVIFAIGINLARAQYIQEQYLEFILQLSRLRMILYWGCLMTAHIFFAAAIIKALTSKNTSRNSPNEPADLLDEFAA